MLSKVMASLMPLPRLDKYVSVWESTLEAALAVIQNAQCPNSWDTKNARWGRPRVCVNGPSAVHKGYRSFCCRPVSTPLVLLHRVACYLDESIGIFWHIMSCDQEFRVVQASSLQKGSYHRPPTFQHAAHVVQQRLARAIPWGKPEMGLGARGPLNR